MSNSPNHSDHINNTDNNPDDDDDGVLEPTIRCKLPAEMRHRSEFKIFDFLRKCIGKELTKISMPVDLNEPLSFLQRLCEYLEYADLLFQADECDDPIGRMELIAAFAVSGASSNWRRLGKPFNPLMGETFEFTLKSSSSSSCSSSSGLTAKLKWRPSSKLDTSSHRVEGFIRDVSGRKLRRLLGRWNDALYSASVEECEEVKSKSSSSSSFWPKRGNSSSAAAQPPAAASAAAGSSSQSELQPDAQHSEPQLQSRRLLWLRRRRSADSDKFYSFTQFALGLNDAADWRLMRQLPPTDTRRRPDVRALELGDLELANQEKLRLEEKQRRARAGQQQQLPLWFKPTKPSYSSSTTSCSPSPPPPNSPPSLPSSSSSSSSSVAAAAWQFDAAYWHREWAACPDIY